ncbi:hypothetical protein BASA62_002257 [Batrachochytrium salamandrivorans]|nr:hypothetical protein BASA62_002257 [Batrachochytrium salamandrivorans]
MFMFKSVESEKLLVHQTAALERGAAVNSLVKDAMSSGGRATHRIQRGIWGDWHNTQRSRLSNQSTAISHNPLPSGP